ncbi:Hect e3 ubiquitin ligase, partial [Globisporangium splendens]
MGVQASRVAASGADAASDGPLGTLPSADVVAAFRRAWRESVPFTLLHDESFVAEKYQELPTTSVLNEDPAVGNETQLISGTNGVPMEELQQVADLARMKLLGKKRKPPHAAKSAGSGTVDGDSVSSFAAGESSEANQASNVLTAGAADKILLRDSAERVASEKLRGQQTEIVKHYFTQLAARLRYQDSDGEASSSSESRGDAVTDELSSPVCLDGNNLRIASSSPGGVFSVSAFRMQLEMLKEFRTTFPRLFESGVLTIVQTLLDFPPFALQSADMTAVEQALISDTHEFCRGILNSEGDSVAASQRQVTLLLLLAFGVSSGRISLLLDFTNGILQDAASETTSSTQVLQGRSFASWVEAFVVRLESFRIDFSLGRFEETNLVKHFPIKLVSSDEGKSSDHDKLPSTQSVTTDGSFAYTWSLKTGIMKIGTGLNFTIAGRIYAESGPAQYLESLQRQRVFRFALYGSGRDVSEVVRAEVLTSTTEPCTSSGRTVRELCKTSDLDDLLSTFFPRKLWLVLLVNGVQKQLLFGDDDELDIFASLKNGDGEEAGYVERRVLTAVYGDFEVLPDKVLHSLNASISQSTNSSAENEGSGITLTSELLAECLADFNGEDVVVSESTELILLCSMEGDGDALELRNFKVGEHISAVEDPATDVYLSSMVYCGGFLFLSALCSSQQGAGRARRLIRVSPQDFSVLGVHTLVGDDTLPPIESKPLFTYITEGLFVYEIQMSADRFHVQVYFPKKCADGSLKMNFVRSFPVHIDQIHCPGFGASLLNILKAEMDIDASNFTPPTMYTNGVWIGMVVPSSTPGEPSHCIQLDCETGAFIEEEPSKAKCSERVIPGRFVCFDAKNNLLWVLESTKGGLSSFQNTGKRISLSQKVTPAQVLDRANQFIGDFDRGRKADDSAVMEHGVGFEDAIAVRVLGVLSQNADACEPSESSALLSSSQANHGSPLIPFAADLQETSFYVLTKLVKEYTASFQANAASQSQMFCFQASLRIFKANVSLLLLQSKGSLAYQKVVKVLREELSVPLTSLTQYTHASNEVPRHQNGARDAAYSTAKSVEQSQRAKLEVVSSAFDLYATCMHIFHADVVKQLDGVLKYLKSWKNSAISATELKIACRLLSHLSNRVDDLQQSIFDSSDNFDRFKQLVDAAVVIQKQKLEVIFDRSGAAAHPFDEDAFLELTALVNTISQSIFLVLAKKAAGSSSSQKKRVVVVFSVFHLLCDGCGNICAMVAERVQNQSVSQNSWLRIENALRQGFVGLISPMLFSSGLAFLRFRDDFVAQMLTKRRDSKASVGAEEEDHDTRARQIAADMFDSLKESAQRMMRLLKTMDVLVSNIEPDAKEKSVESVVTAVKMESMESAHEYANNLDELTELHIAGATRMIITFDSRSRTEYNYDYVTFFKDKSKREYFGEKHYSGRDAEYNWPGVGSNPPLVIESDRCFVAFHSDRSNTDWGFKFTAKGQILQKKVSVKRHWMIFLAESIAHVLDECIKIFVDGSLFSPLNEAEFLNERFLQSDLVKNGICTEQNQNANVLQLLKDFVNPPEDSQAAMVIQALLKRSGTFRQRSVSNGASSFTSTTTSDTNPNHRIDSAVRAVAAAILHHNMWGMDAYAYARNLRTDVSEQLLKGWKNAQKMRDWFHLGDAADASLPTRRHSRNLQRQPSAFKGMSEEALLILCTNVIERAQFLLELTPASFSYVSGAKRRWGLLAKYGHAIGKSGSSETSLEKWYNLLDELQAATELRSLFQYRRNSSERMRGSQAKSVTEQVLEFIQSDVDVGELRRIIDARNTRARSRAFGMELFVGTWQCYFSARVQSVLAESLAATMKTMVQSYTFTSMTLATPSDAISSRVHFALKLSGCQESLRQSVVEAYGKCLAEFSSILNSISSLDHHHCPLIIGVLKACALDYDLEDSYLLHESRILTQVLRLLSSDVIQIRRAAQSLLGVFLSRFVVGRTGSNPERSSDPSDSDEVYDATTFQRQLFTTVGLQLEGIVSVVNSPAVPDKVTIDSHGRGMECSSSHQRYYYLPDCSPGLTAPSLQITGVRWNHSILIWVYVYSENSVYALKVGDEVQRGPNWKEDSEDDGGETETGMVMAIVHPTRIEVRWSKTNVVGEYTFDPKTGVFEVILVGEGVGGVIFFSGNKTMAKDTAFAVPWSSFGLFLNDQRQLSYKIAAGAERECVYNCNYEIGINEWSHIAIVQDEDTLRFHVNGIMASQHVLDPFLLMQGNANAAESKIIESAHPFPDSVDQYWPVHIPGAVKIRVTFDPLCEIDRSTGFVRFYKNVRCNDFWGEEKYSGKYHDPERNFPGAQSQRARGRRGAGMGINTCAPNSIEIPSDRFVVYFHNEEVSSGWGFRLLAVPEFPADASLSDLHDEKDRLLTPLLNPYPFYFGEPPGRVLDEVAATCSLYQPKVLQYPVSESDVIAEIQATCPSSETVPVPPPSERLLYILGLMQTCSDTPFGRSLIGKPENIGNLMSLALDTRRTAELRCASLGILRDLVTFLSPEIAAVQFKRVMPSSSLNSDFAEHLFDEIAGYLNIWRMYSEEEKSLTVHADKAEAEGVLDLRVSAHEANSLVAGYISLLRCMVAHFNWSEAIFKLISASLAELKSVVNRGDIGTFGRVLASCALLGGSYDGITIGGRVKCCVNIDGKETIETGYLLQFRLKHGIRTAQVLFDCDKSRPIEVPVSDIAYLGDEDKDELEAFLGSLSPLFVDEIKDLFTTILSLDASQLQRNQEKYKAKMVRKENVEVLESEHPYASGEEVTYPLDFPGAHEIVIYFDSTSCTAGPNDFVRFLKRSDNESGNKSQGSEKREYWGQHKYYGDQFPGIGNIPPLRIPASSVDVYFSTDSPSTSDNSTEWGFKLTAHAFEDTLSYPPEIPPAVFASAVNDVQARCLKAISLLFRLQQQSEVIPMFAPLVSPLAKLANAPSEGRPTCPMPKSQIFESKHPYSNSVMEYLGVTFSGASVLHITFDEQSNTEHGCDYLCFFKDKSLSDRWGAHQYSGAGATANWPGCGGRAPLTIPGDSFTLLWCTDISNVEWGWKFTVTPEFKPAAPLSLSLDQLDKRSYHLFEILYEKMRPQRCPFSEEFDGFEVISDGMDDGMQHKEPVRQLFLSSNTTEIQCQPRNVREPRFCVVDKAGVVIYKKRSKEASIGELATGDEFISLKSKDGWIKLSFTNSVTQDSQTGWIWQRTGDKLHVAAADCYTRHEDLLVLGVDDLQMEAHRSVLEMDESNPEQDVMSTFFSQFSFESLKGQHNRFQSFAYDSHRAFAIKCAREALLSFFSFQAASDVTKLFSKLPSAFENSGAEAKVLETTLHRFIDDAKNDATLSQVVDRCLDLLNRSPQLLPANRGVLRVVESMHPYDNDMNKYWQVSIPGAKRIVVTFDPRSKSESGSDWLCLYKVGSSRSEFFGEAQYGGREGSENWPGFGGRPPLVVDADCFEVYFHSNESNNDWGFKLFAVGVFEVGGAHEDSTRDIDIGSAVRILKICCWILEVLSAALANPDKNLAVSKLLYSSHMLQTMTVCLEQLPQQLRPKVLQILINMALCPSLFHTLSPVQVEKARDLVHLKLRAQYRSEEAVESKSHYLQMLVQCSIAIDLAIESSRFKLLLQSPSQMRKPQLLLPSEHKSGENSCLWILDEFQAAKTHQYQILLKKVTAPFVVGMWAAAPNSSDKSTRFIGWSHVGSLSVVGGNERNVIEQGSFRIPLLSEGDTAGFELDFDKRVLILRKNNAVASVISADEFLGGSAPWSAIGLSNFEKRCLTVGAESSDSTDEVLGWKTSASPLSLLSPRIEPSWYGKVVESVGALMDLRDNRSEQVVVKESLHPLRPESVSSDVLETIRIPGAIGLEVKFDKETRMRKKDCLEFYAQPSGYSGKQGSPHASLIGLSGHDDQVQNPLLFVQETYKRNSTLLRVGDQVVRSCDWEYGDEDGGVGSVGVVEEIVPWESSTGAGVRVLWRTSGKERVYRHGFRGHFDVQLHPHHKYRDLPLVIPGDSLSYAVRFGESIKSSLAFASEVDAFQGSLHLRDTSALKLELGDDANVSDKLNSDRTLEMWIDIDSKWRDRLEDHLEDTRMELLCVESVDSTAVLWISVDYTGALVVMSDPGLKSTVSEEGDGAVLANEIENPKATEFGDWFHFALVIAGSRILIYQNGDLRYAATQRERQRSTLNSVVFNGKYYKHSSIMPFCGHLYDVRLWDVALKMEQLKSHSKGLDSIMNGNETRSRSGSSLPGTPRALKQPLSPFLVPPSPPRSPSRSAVLIPNHMKKWTTTNRTGKEMVSVRLNTSILDVRTSGEGDSLLDLSVAYYEAYPLSSGKVSVGWMWSDAKPDTRDFMVGESATSFGIELQRKLTHFRGETMDLEPLAALQGNSLNSPREGGIKSSFSSDFIVGSGDVLGCAFVRRTSELVFFINGQYVARVGLHDTVAEGETNAMENEPTGVQAEGTGDDFDQLVSEMCSMGFSRQSSTEALASSGADNSLAAVDWLLQRDQRELAPVSPASGTASGPSFASPRKRSVKSRSNSESFALVEESKPATERGITPAATLGHQGAQGVVWNFGQNEFKYRPAIVEGNLVSVLEATGCAEEELSFEIFDPVEHNWEQIAYRHKVQDIEPRMMAWWKLGEGEGLTLGDSSGYSNAAKAILKDGISERAPDATSSSSSSKEQNTSLLWDQSCSPPFAALKRNNAESMSPFLSTSSPEEAAREPGASAATESAWGYRFYVIPHFSVDSIGHDRFQEHILLQCESPRGVLLRHDKQLVKYVNKVAQSKQLNVSQLLRVTWNEITPHEEELVRWPTLMEIATGVASTDDATTEDATPSAITKTSGVMQKRLEARFKVIQDFNASVHRLLPFVVFQSPSVSESASSSHVLHSKRLCDLVSEQRHRIFNLVKRVVWDDALRCTNKNSVAFELTLNRPKAMRYRASGKPDSDGRYTLFSQAFRQLNSLDGAHFRRTDNFYHVNFLGENATDAGGPYRETLAQYCEELHSTQLPLLLPTSNSQHNVGAGREKWILNPGARTATLLQMFEFLGKLMGVVLRSKQYLSLNVASIIWKKLVGEKLHIDDLAAVDSMIVNSMTKMRTIDTYGVTEEMFEDIVLETFTTLSSDNRVVALKPHGQSTTVTFANRCEYADLVEQYRLQEFDLQIAVLLRGISKVVPAKLLSCFTGIELELMVCGTPEIDVDLLARCTEYSSCSAHDEHIVWFWQVLRSFSHEERSAFLRFVWGRSRLPANEKEFPQFFKLQSFSKAQPGRSMDAYLPISHTCFFSVEMPIYSSEQVLREKLLYAIYNCQEIDGDGDSVAANQLGWEE